MRCVLTTLSITLIRHLACLRSLSTVDSLNAACGSMCVCPAHCRRGSSGKYEKFHSVLSLLSYMLKAPLVPPGTPIINALFAQRQCIANLLRACIGLAPENHMMLEHKLTSCIEARYEGAGHSATANGNGVAHSEAPPAKKLKH